MDDPNKPLVLVDSSYFSIKRATALMSWWTRAHPDDPRGMNQELPWVLNPVYMEKYTKLYKQNIDNICKHFGVRHEDILFARDCPRSEIWRCDLFPGYKGTRAGGVVEPDVMSQIQTKITALLQCGELDPSWQGLEGRQIMPHEVGMGPVIKHNNASFLDSGYVRLMRIAGAEADDIVAVVAMQVRKLQPNRRIIIVANDQDYMQLHDDHLEVVELSAKFKNIRKGDLTGEQYLLHKIIGGDTSDNIPSCGIRGAKALAQNPDALASTLKENESFRKQFELNSKLVDFRQMPAELQDTIWQQFLEIAPEFKHPVAATTLGTTVTTTKIIPKISLKPRLTQLPQLPQLPQLLQLPQLPQLPQRPQLAQLPRLARLPSLTPSHPPHRSDQNICDIL